MTSERWRQLEELSQAARDLSASQQSALLESADPELRAAVTSILAQEGARQEGSTFLERAAWEGLQSLLKTRWLTRAAGSLMVGGSPGAGLPGRSPPRQLAKVRGSVQLFPAETGLPAAYRPLGSEGVLPGLAVVHSP